MIRKATMEDMPEILQIGEDFCAAAGQKFNADALYASIENLLEMQNAVVLISETGVIAGLIYPYFFNGETVAQELFWWAKKDGLKLLEAFEQWAKDMGATQVMMICLEAIEPDRVSALYRRRGYEPLERVFVRIH